MVLMTKKIIGFDYKGGLCLMTSTQFQFSPNSDNYVCSLRRGCVF